MRLQEHQVEELLKYDLGLEKVRRHVGRKGVNFQFCCPFHGETRPSAGVVIDNSDGSVYGQCYSCEETFSLAKLVAHVKEVEVYEAINYIEEKFNVEMRDTIVGKTKLRRYEEALELKRETTKRFELPMTKLAPFRSGKETHKYFFERGFTKQTVKECLIGWDRVKKRVTIPVFHPDGALAGIIGRAVLEQKLPNGKPNPKYLKVYGNQPKYYIYDNFPIGEVLYGSHDFYSEDDTAIIVEGTLDRLWLRQLGFRNVLSIIVAKMSMDKKTGVSTQAQILHQLGVKRVVFMHDNDEAGEVGKAVAYKILKNEFICYDVKYPDGFKDPVGLTREQVEYMLANKKLYGKKELKRL